MLKNLMTLVVIFLVLSCAGCNRIQRVLAPDAPSDVTPTDVQPPKDMTPTDVQPPKSDNEGIGIFDTSVMAGHGLEAEVYIPGGEILYLPTDFEPLTPIRTFSVANVDVPERDYEEGFPELGIDVLENFAIRLRGKLKVETPGQYNFALASDDGSKLYVNGNLIIDNDGLHGMRTERGSLTLTAGMHDIEIQYFQGPRTEIGLQWFWQPPNGTEQIVPPEVLYPPGPDTSEVTQPTPPSTPPSGMVLIPAGTFQMGEEGFFGENPVHTVHLDAFYMDVYEVTNAQFKAFVDANPQWQKDSIDAGFHSGNYLSGWDGNTYPAGRANHPVTSVSWYAAMAYAAWAGKRLPTEAEWEYAARGGLAGQKYPWGNTITDADANYGGNVGDTTPVGAYAANGYGLYDMAGNVWEWCLDVYDSGFYAASENSRNPIAGGESIQELRENFTSLSTNSLRVLRGSWWTDGGPDPRVAARHSLSPSAVPVDGGFRCVRAVTP